MTKNRITVWLCILSMFFLLATVRVFAMDILSDKNNTGPKEQISDSKENKKRQNIKTFKGQVKTRILIDSKVSRNKNFNVKVIYSGKKFSGVHSNIKFKPDEIKYISGDGKTVNNGVVRLQKNKIQSKFIFNLKFKALLGGTSNLSLITLRLYDCKKRMMAIPTVDESFSISGQTAYHAPAKPVEEDSTNSEEIISKEIKEREEFNLNIYIGIILLFVIAIMLFAVARRSKK